MANVVVVPGTQVIDILNGKEKCYEFTSVYRSFNVQNLSDSEIFVSLNPEANIRYYGVTVITPGGSAVIDNRYIEGRKVLYIYGTGQIQITATNGTNFVYQTGQTSTGGSPVEPEPTYQYMPVMTGITGFFEPSGIDITNGVWYNAVGENDMILTGGTIENGVLKFAASEYGEISEATEPDVYYIVFQKPAVGDDKECLIGKELTSNIQNHARELHVENIENNTAKLQLTKNGSPYINGKIDKTKYHIAVISNKKDINSGSGFGVAFFIDSNLIGAIIPVSKGSYKGKIIINNGRRDGASSWPPLTDTYIKMVAIGGEQSVNDIIKNSEYLMKKFI